MILGKHPSALGMVIALFSIVFPLQTCLSADIYQPPSGLYCQRDLPGTREYPGTAIAFTVSSQGDLVTLLSEPSRLIKRNLRDQSSVEINRGFSSHNHPTDLYSDNCATFLIVDPLNDNILRINSRLDILPPIELVSDQNRMEPLSVCRDLSDGIYFINRTDLNLWKIDPTGNAVMLRNAISGSMKLKHPRRIRYSDYSDRILILDEESLKGFSRFGYPDFLVKLTVSNPVAFDISGREVWVVGDGISCVDLASKREVFVLPSDSLAVWIADPPIDICVSQANSLFLQSRKGSVITSFSILRHSSE